jgi:hypothetical protein
VFEDETGEEEVCQVSRNHGRYEKANWEVIREEAKRLVMESDNRLDQKAMEEFVSFMGYISWQFCDIVERFWNPGILQYLGIKGSYLQLCSDLVREY